MGGENSIAAALHRVGSTFDMASGF
jgi:hypothetical protein